MLKFIVSTQFSKAVIPLYTLINNMWQFHVPIQSCCFILATVMEVLWCLLSMVWLSKSALHRWPPLLQSIILANKATCPQSSVEYKLKASMFPTQRLLLPAYQTCDSCQKLICFSYGEVGHTVWGVAPANSGRLTTQKLWPLTSALLGRSSGASLLTVFQVTVLLFPFNQSILATVLHSLKLNCFIFSIFPDHL